MQETLSPVNLAYKRLLDSFRLIRQDYEADVFKRFAEQVPQRLGQQGKLTTAEVFYVDYCIKQREPLSLNNAYYDMLRKHVSEQWLQAELAKGAG